MDLTPKLNYYQVVIKATIYQSFTYYATQKDLLGHLVSIPFGKNNQQLKLGFVIKQSTMDELKQIETKKIKPKAIKEVLSQKPLLNSLEIQWLQKSCTYYHQPIGEFFFQALPKMYKNINCIEKINTIKTPQSFIFWQKTKSPKNSLKISVKQQELVNFFPENTCINELNLKKCPTFSKQRILRLEQLGLIKQKIFNFKKPKDLGKIKLTNEQKIISEKIKSKLDQFSIELIYGDTASGKTEIYLDLIRQVLKKTKQILFLVPEIGLIQQTKMRIEKATGLPVLAIHSAVTKNEQFIVYQKIKSAEFAILVGTRSSVFYSFNNLGLIVIDEEHDSSYKQIDQLSYSAKKLALLKAKMLNIPIILGSATPSLEMIKLVDEQKISLHRLVKKQTSQRKVQLIDISDQAKDYLLSPTLLESIAKNLQKQKQCLIFLNRRGYAPILKCSNCHWVYYCDHCDSPFVFHRFDNMMHCHHCQLKKPLINNCQICGASPLKLFGFGTEKLEEKLSKYFEQTKIWRIDKDQTQKKDAFNQLINAIENNPSGIIIGTQMLSKGHDFSNVSLVALVNLNSIEHNSDLYAKEQFSQLLIQVIGRTGRNKDDYEIAIQYRTGENKLIKNLIHYGYDGFLINALKTAKKYRLSPYAYQAACKADCPNKDQLYQFLHRWRNELKKFDFKGKVDIWQIQPTPIEKRINRYRAYFMLYALNENDLHQAFKLNTDLILPKIKIPQNLRYHLDINCNGIDF